MLNTAVLITGELRFDNEEHYKSFKNSINGCDVFISTYPKYENLAKSITHNYIIADTKLPIGNMYQWWHLNNIISTYNHRLVLYDCIVKLRTDINYNQFDLKKLKIEYNTTHVQTDQIFYSNSYDFINTFKDFYENMVGLYIKKSKLNYIPLNYYNFIKSNSSNVDIKIGWLTLPEIIYSHTLPELQQKIKENSDIFLNDEMCDTISKMEMRIGFVSGYDFSSEKCFTIHCFNKGMVSQSEIVGSLMADRKQFKWNLC